MYASKLIVYIFARYNGQRGPSSVYHLFKGKKSGQTIQDVGLFQLHPFFSITPKLHKTQYDTYFNQLIQQQFLLLTEHTVYVTEKGWAFIEGFDPGPLDGWHYRGNEMIFMKRLSLVVQTLSHYARGASFIPIEQDGAIQRYVKSYLRAHQFQQPLFQETFTKQFIARLDTTRVEELSKQVFVLRLSGYEMSGHTWQQIQTELGEDVFSLQLRFIQCLHGLLMQLTETPLLEDLAQHIKIEQHYTQSTEKTFSLFKEGYTLSQIAQIRHLKESTIEDHFAEMAMVDEDFPIYTFLSKELRRKIEDVATKLQTTKLRQIKENVEQASYFQIRLVLAARRESKWN
ncbi:helix-turn-helix domain-containing protein [Kurthia senegalensis]|uniref:helix-turn-helix domain-containing protein n=1 Tax=Kurthia senegalensis TaxID=1033740 RepID=UPI00028A090C|nr:helix-turn-helix domain-containing protein [Kurthia senegalensis]